MTDQRTQSEAMQQSHVSGWRGITLVCAVGVIWGTIGPAVDVVHERGNLTALTISAWRSVAGLATFAAVVVLTRRGAALLSVIRTHTNRVVVVGCLTAAFQLFFFLAVVTAGVSVTTVVCLGFPPVLLLGLRTLQQRRLPSVTDRLTVTVAVAGLLLVGLAGGGDLDAPQPALGVLAALISGTAYGLSAEFGGALSRENDPIAVAASTAGFASIVLIGVGFGATMMREEPLITRDLIAWLVVGYLGAVTMTLAYALFFAGLRSTPSGTVVIATLLEPVTAVLIAVLLLGEQLTPAGVIGSLLILTAIASLGQRQRPEPH